MTDNAEWYQVYRDGKPYQRVVAPMTENEASQALMKFQGQSTDYAIKYGGWSIKPYPQHIDGEFTAEVHGLRCRTFVQDDKDGPANETIAMRVYRRNGALIGYVVRTEDETQNWRYRASFITSVLSANDSDDLFPDPFEAVKWIGEQRVPDEVR